MPRELDAIRRDATRMLFFNQNAALHFFIVGVKTLHVFVHPMMHFIQQLPQFRIHPFA